VRVPGFKITACTADHIGDRSEQQDRVAVLTSARNAGTLMAIVADGMGGRTGGRLAADQVISTADGLFQDLSEKDVSLRELLEQIASEAHTVIRLSALSSEKEPHSTMVALVLKREGAIWAHAGDSRLYFFRNGRLLRRTEDHTFAAQLREEGKTAEAEVAQTRFKNVLVSALGIAREPRVAISETGDLRPGDAFVLCSDGVWAYFKDEELGSIVQTMNARDACTEILRLARDRSQGRGDNLSLAIVRLEAGDPIPLPRGSFRPE
jgi:PPM family protein phosphatase